MDKKDDISYAAVITMTLPGEEKPINLTLTLSPTSPIKLSKGRVKPLRDCTLAELQQFAEKMEADIWARHEHSSLAELLESGDTHLDVTLLDKGKEASDDSSDHKKNWMELSVTLPDKETTAETTPESEKEIDQEKSGEAESVDPAETTPESEEPEPNAPTAEKTAPEEPEEEPADEALAGALLEETAGEIDEVAEEASAEPEEEPEPDVTVSEVEPVHEERESPTEITPPPVKPGKLRVLGKRRPLNHPTWTATDILINEPAFRDAQAHALSSLSREVAGFLIGPQPEKQPDGRYLVHISDVIIAKHTRMQGASVTYTPESWRYATDRLEEMYPDETAVIVGWYHTHPGFGIFLSGMDQFIHRNFFTQIWHVALVLDPIARRSGFFCWDRPQAKVDHYEFPWPSWAAGSW